MLPITRVVLFKHGVAYYQREGFVTDNEVIQLSFKEAQMNDVLKSLTTLDFNDGSFGSLSYDSEEPIEKRLAEFNISIPKKGAITNLLDQLKGSKVKLNYKEQTILGAIIGIEELTVASDKSLTEPHLAIFTRTKGIAHYRLSELTEIVFEDSTVQDELNSLLDILSASLNKGQKRLSIYTMGKGKREVSVSYVVESPVWKTSYRLVLPPTDYLPTDSIEAMLQGWALVDNITDEDWQNINLSLVAGLPISFIHDLYTPRFRQRPIIAVEQEAVTAAPIVEAGHHQMFEEPEIMLDDLGEGMTLGAAEPVAAEAFASPSLSRAVAYKQSVTIQAKGQEIGDLFSYDITQPVAVERGRSALVPILQTNIDANKILFYNQAIRDKNPLASFYLKNTSELTLEGGPITVFESDNYVGEAMLETMKAGSERIVPYSVELAIHISQKYTTNKRYYTHITKKGQSVIKHYREEYITEYIVASTLDQERILYLDHQFRYELSEKPDNLVEITDNYWRFRVAIQANQETIYKVIETRQSYDSIHIPSIAHQDILALNQLKLISDHLKQQFEAIAILAAEKENLCQQHKQSLNRLRKIEKGQDRVRKNIEVLSNSPEEAKLKQRYVKTLSMEEDQLEQFNEEVNRLDKSINEKADEINQAVEKLKFEE